MAIEEILLGIDQTETESDEGWWETSAGAVVGAVKMAQVKRVIAERDATIAQLVEALEKVSDLTPLQICICEHITNTPCLHCVISTALEAKKGEVSDV